MKLNEVRDNKGAHRDRKRVGRGIGSGTGKTSAKGMKGQKSRSGVSLLGFEGGQMPLYRRLPKRGFNPLNPKEFVEVNLGQLQKAIDEKKVDAKKPINAEVLIGAGFFKKAKDGVRLLGKGELKAKIEIEVAGASKTAVAAVEKAGGKVTVIVPKVPAHQEAAIAKKAAKDAAKA